MVPATSNPIAYVPGALSAQAGVGLGGLDAKSIFTAAVDIQRPGRVAAFGWVEVVE